MSKKVRNLILCGAAVLLLAGALALLLLLPKGEDAQPSSSAIGDTQVKMLDEDYTTLTSLEIKNEKDSYTIEAVGEKKWGIKALENYPQVDDFATVVTDVSSIYATSVVEESCTDFTKYGLDSAPLTFTAKYSAGTSHTVEVGDTLMDGSTSYARLAGSDTVYQVASSKYDSVRKSRFDYLDKTLLAAAGVDEAGQPVQPRVSFVEIYREDMEKPITLKSYDKAELSENSVMMTELQMLSPVVSAFDANNQQAQIMDYFGLVADGIVAVAPTPEQLLEYGLDKPVSTYSMTYDETKKVKFSTGKTVKAEDGKSLVYLLKEGEDMVYQVDGEKLKWITVKPEDLVSSIAVLAPVLDLESVSVTLDGTTNVISYFAGAGDKATQEMTAKLNGTELKIDHAKKYLQLIYATSIDGINKETTTEAPKVTILYKYLSGKTDKVELYVRADLKTIVSVNGNMAFTGRNGFVDKLRKETKNLVDGKAIDTEW